MKFFVQCNLFYWWSFFLTSFASILCFLGWFSFYFMITQKSFIALSKKTLYLYFHLYFNVSIAFKIASFWSSKHYLVHISFPYPYPLIHISFWSDVWTCFFSPFSSFKYEKQVTNITRKEAQLLTMIALIDSDLIFKYYLKFTTI